MIPDIIGALGPAPKNLEKRLEELDIRGRIETIQTCKLKDMYSRHEDLQLLTSARIVRRGVQET